MHYGLFVFLSGTISFQLYHGGQFYCCRKPEYLEKSTDFPQVTNEQYHTKLYQVRLNMGGNQTHSSHDR